MTMVEETKRGVKVEQQQQQKQLHWLRSAVIRERKKEKGIGYEG